MKAEYFPIRGVIEGFYGTPWSHSDRLDMLMFMQKHGFNAYFYSPKDDPYLREEWEEPHPTEQLAHIEELILHSRDYGLAFYYCLSPGLSMEYSNELHLQKCMEKYERMHRLGVSHFGLFFDDIPRELMHERDKERFSDLADAHKTIIHKIWNGLSELGSDCKLVVCPTLYHGLGNEPYITDLGNHLSSEIQMFWTGRFICSPYLTKEDADRYFQWTGHKPLLWDNYPVNDLAMANELHIGPLQNRDPELYRASSGYVANAMKYMESSKIPLATVADYLREPEQYDHMRSWQKAIEEVVGTIDAPLFRRFADNVKSSFLNDQESHELMAALQSFRFHLQHGDANKAVSQMKELFNEMEQTALYLLGQMRNRRLAVEVRPWVEKYLHWAKVGQSAMLLIEEGIRGRTAQAFYHLLRFKQWLKRAERLPQKVCGDVMRVFADAVLQEVQKRRV